MIGRGKEAYGAGLAAGALAHADDAVEEVLRVELRVLRIRCIRGLNADDAVQGEGAERGGTAPCGTRPVMRPPNTNHRLRNSFSR